MSADFIHLKLHSEYSVVDGIVRLDDLIAAAVDNQMPAVAITDRVNLFAMVKFYRKALAAGVKPIIGADIILQDGEDESEVTLLCQNQTGYHHLSELVSKAYLQGQASGKPCVQWQWLKAANQGLIVLSGGCHGDVGLALLANKPQQAAELLQRWKHTFADRYYLELTRTHKAQEKEYIHAVIPLAKQYQVPVVASNDVRFMDRDDFEAHEARACIHSGYVLEDQSRPRHYTEQQYFKTQQEMKKLFADIPEALQNSIEIAKRCNLQLLLGKPFLPNFPVPDNISLENYLEQQARQGLAARYESDHITEAKSREAYDKRLQFELDIINEMGFPGYFLIVADFIRWAKQHGIPVGPGRGSGAGSLVAYALQITEVDPMVHDLLFERFLNPERVSMPDFDIDFCMEGRDTVIDYVAQRYGRDAVSQIITYGTMAAKAVIRDVGRVLSMPYGYVDKIAKLIPFELGMTLDKALAQEERLKELYDTEPEITTLIDLAKKLEGVTRNAGKHAGGVVIAPTKLTDFVPLYCEQSGDNLVTQFDKNDVEAVGLVKFDFLGLRTLTIINWALQTINIKRQQTGEVAIRIEDIPLDDAATFKLLQSCATTAVFQLESRGMKDLIKRLRPDTFEDIKALVALFRPGPLQSGMVDDFINRKHGRESIRYSHPDLEPILNSTYGIILYQEQVMQIAQVLAGYTLGQADILRSAMGKKKPQEMAKQRKIFMEGAEKRGIDPRIAEHIFDLMEKFAGYGFNKSHSTAYALISYQTAWLKAHYPAEFMAAVLSSDMDNTDKVVGLLDECKNMQLKILPPDVNRSQYQFTVSNESRIVYGLGAVKGVGEGAIESIVNSRTEQGEFSDLFDFCRRVDMHKINRRGLEPLIYSGAMDGFKQPRSVLMASLDKALKAAEQQHRNQALGQNDLFGTDSFHTDSDTHYVQCKTWSDAERLQAEKDTLGFYLTGHPLGAFKEDLQRICSTSIASLSTAKKNVSVAGLIVGIRTINTKSGRRMCIVTLEDLSGRIDITLFSKAFEEARPHLIKDSIVIVKGKIADDSYTGGIKLMADSVTPFDDIKQQMIKRLVIAVNDQTAVDQLLQGLTGTLQPFIGGDCPIVIRYQADQANAELILGRDWQVQPKTELLMQLKQLCGEEKVLVEY